MVTVNEKRIPFTEKMTAADAIESAGITIDKMTIIVVDNTVISAHEIRNKPISYNSIIKVFPVISGG
jgi:thiamine biosynthesis protein ThiS